MPSPTDRPAGGQSADAAAPIRDMEPVGEASVPDGKAGSTAAGDEQSSPSLVPRKSFAALAPVYTVKLVQTGSIPLPNGRLQIKSANDTAELLSRYLDGADREHLVAVLLDTQAYLIAVSTISIGDLSSTIVHPREVFKVAILANAASMILAHNHPSGKVYVSNDDITVTKLLMDAGRLLGIEIQDHVIVGSPAHFFSLKENGLCL